MPPSCVFLIDRDASGLPRWNEAGGRRQEEPLLHLCGHSGGHGGQPLSGSLRQLGRELRLLVLYGLASVVCVCVWVRVFVTPIRNKERHSQQHLCVHLVDR